MQTFEAQTFDSIKNANDTNTELHVFLLLTIFIRFCINDLKKKCLSFSHYPISP